MPILHHPITPPLRSPCPVAATPGVSRCLVERGEARMRHRHTIGIHRRELIQAGFSGLLGCGLVDLLGMQSAPAGAAARGGGPRAKSVILVFMTGAPAHQDIWDIDMIRPVEYRGEARSIKTNVPGIEISEHLPLLAKMADRYSIVRSMYHNNNVHEFGTHFMLTGIDQIPVGARHFATRADWPAMGSIVSFARPSPGGMPSAVILPTYLNNGYGFSGQTGG